MRILGPLPLFGLNIYVIDVCDYPYITYAYEYLCVIYVCTCACIHIVYVRIFLHAPCIHMYT